MQRSNVLSRRCRPTTKSYRGAVKKIVLGLQAQHELNDPELAERLGCSAGTVKNARTEATNLDGVTLANIEYEFGPAALDPFLDLGGSRAVPNDVAQCNGQSATMDLSQVLHLLIAAQCPASEGGVEITPQELARILPQLREARSSLDVLIDRARFVA